MAGLVLLSERTKMLNFYDTRKRKRKRKRKRFPFMYISDAPPLPNAKTSLFSSTVSRKGKKEEGRRKKSGSDCV